MADHDVAEEDNPDGNEPIVAEEEGGQKTDKSAEALPNDLTGMEWVSGGIDGQAEGKDEDIDNAVADDHLVHPVLLLLHDDHHCPSVEGDGEKKNGKSNPKEKGIRDLRITIKTKWFFSLVSP